MSPPPCPSPDELPDDAKAGVIRELDRLVTALARYLVTCRCRANSISCGPGRTQPHRVDVSALEARIALRRSAQVLHSAAASTTGDISTGETHPATRRLADAATELAAGRDLLHTHERGPRQPVRPVGGTAGADARWSGRYRL